jgi:antitoxin HigA-1
VIKSFRHKGLARLFLQNDPSRVRSDLVRRCRIRLSALHRAEHVTALNIPGFDLHALRGKPPRYSLHVNGPLVHYLRVARWSRLAGRSGTISLRVTMQDEIEVSCEPAMVPTHPGELLREDVLPALGLSVSEAARQLGVTRQTLHRILAGTHGITPEMALRLGRFCGNGPVLWLRMQQAYDLWHAERRLGDLLDKIPMHRSAA